jgi:hypothetical protein
MKNQFCNYEISLNLKELGFDEPCFAYYLDPKYQIYEDIDGNKTNFMLLSAKKSGELVGHGFIKNSLFIWLKENDKISGELYILSKSCCAVLWQQAIEWIFIKFSIYINIYPIVVSTTDKSGYRFSFDIYDVINDKTIFDETALGYYSLNEARSVAILKSFKLCTKINI